MSTRGLLVHREHQFPAFLALLFALTKAAGDNSHCKFTFCTLQPQIGSGIGKSSATSSRTSSLHVIGGMRLTHSRSSIELQSYRVTEKPSRRQNQVFAVNTPQHSALAFKMPLPTVAQASLTPPTAQSSVIKCWEEPAPP
ncbi:uncharacterized protein UDID_18720 [Ustilago sp. UG-2017a]|nr:uncharacterized protein UDID_18720 [Ustilago sp. UG-2017a]